MRSQKDALSRVLDEQFVSPKIEPGDAVVTRNPSVQSPEDDIAMMGLDMGSVSPAPIASTSSIAGRFNDLDLLKEYFDQSRRQESQLGTVDEAEFFRDDERRAFDAVANPSLPFDDPRYSGLSVFDQVYNSTASNPNQSFAGADGPDRIVSPLQQTMQSYFDPSFTGEENEDATQTDLESLFRDQPDIIKNIMERSTPFKSETFPTMAGILGKAMGGANINNIINKINEGGVPQLDAQGNIQGVVHDGFFGKVYSGNEEYNPFAGPKPEREENILPILPIPEAETPLTVTPPVVVDPTPPVTPPDPTDVRS
jgi:hypothetical protein